MKPKIIYKCVFDERFDNAIRYIASPIDIVNWQACTDEWRNHIINHWDTTIAVQSV